MNPTVSIIIPCHNAEATIGETLDSLLGQTLPEWEAIVVNDGSRDRSRDVLSDYRSRDRRINILEQENRGLAAARNAALERAGGEYVIFLDADDLLLPEMLRRMVDLLRNNRSIAAAHCAWIFTDQTGKDRSWVSGPIAAGNLFERLAHQNPFPCHTLLLRRSVLSEVGEFDVSLARCHDWDLWLRVARTGAEIGVLPEPLAVYRMMPASLSSDTLSHFAAGNHIIARCHRRDPRVRRPDAKFAGGCPCGKQDVPSLEWLMVCAASAIAKGDAVQAFNLVEQNESVIGTPLTPEKLARIKTALWYANALPPGNWQILWKRISRPLLQFLLMLEERSKTPGLAVETLLAITSAEPAPVAPPWNPDTLDGKTLMALLTRKGARKLRRIRSKLVN